MLLSIIVPVFNVETYICQCIDSILGINGIEYECIIINDGSTDKSKELLEKYSTLHNIQIVNQENKGLSEARNVGLSLASGEYVAFIDSDDFINPKDFEELFYKGREVDADIIVGDFYNFYNENKSEISDNSKICDYNLLQSHDFFTMFYKKISSVVWRNIYKRKLLKDKAMLFHKGVYFEDVEWTCKLYSIDCKVLYVPICFYYYRQRIGSIMNSNCDIKHLKDSYIIFHSLNKLSIETESEKLKSVFKIIGLHVIFLTLSRYEGIVPTYIWDELSNYSDTKYLNLKWKLILLINKISKRLCRLILKRIYK